MAEYEMANGTLFMPPTVVAPYYDTADDNMTSLNASTMTTPVDSSNNLIHVYINLPIQIVLGLVSIVANMLTLMALSTINSKFHPHLLLVVNLSISDLLFGIRTVVFRGLWFSFHFDEDLKMWFSSDPGCARGLIRVLGSCVYTCTYINLIAMAFDLYFAILMPFTYQKMVTRKRTLILCVLMWVVAILLSLANYIVGFFHYLGHIRDSTYCDIRNKYTRIDVYLYLAVVYLGIIFMTYAYIRIFIEVRRCAKYTPGLPMREAQKVKSKKRKVITSLLVLVTFLVGWLPNGIITNIYFIKPGFGGSTLHTVGLYFASLPMANSVCDPIIYAIRLDKVRIGFRKLCGHRRMSIDQSDITEQISLAVSNKDPSSPNGKNAPIDVTEMKLLNSKTSNGNGEINLLD